MGLDSFKLERYRTFERLSNEVEKYLKKADDVHYTPLQQSNHSEAWRIDLYRKEKKLTSIFGKQLLRPQDTSAHYTGQHDPHSLFMRELTYTDLITNNIGDLVPRIVGYSKENWVLLFEFLIKKSDHALLIEAFTSGDPEKRLALIYDGARKVATFDGRLHSHAERFTIQSRPRPTSGKLTEDLYDYLSKIVMYAHQSELRDDFQDSATRVRQFVSEKYHVDLYDSIEDLVKRGEALSPPDYRLQHRDCRLKHVIGKKLVDIGSIGEDRHGRDLVTYLSAEGRIATPDVNIFPQLLSYFLAYEAANHMPKKIRREQISALNAMTPEEAANTISPGDLVSFTMQFLRMMIEEDLHLDACNKRYPEEVQKQFVAEVPGHTLEKMLSSRLEHIEEVFGLIAEQTLYWGLVQNSSEMREYFSRFAELLEKLDLIHLKEGTLDKIRGRTYRGESGKNGNGGGKS